MNTFRDSRITWIEIAPNYFVPQNKYNLIKNYKKQKKDSDDYMEELDKRLSAETSVATSGS